MLHFCLIVKIWDCEWDFGLLAMTTVVELGQNT